MRGVEAFLYAMGLVGSLISARALVASLGASEAGSRRQEQLTEQTRLLRGIHDHLVGNQAPQAEELGHGYSMDFSDIA